MFGFAPFGATPFSALPQPGVRMLIALKTSFYRKTTGVSFVIALKLSANSEFRIFAATRDYLTAPGDALASRQFDGTLTQPLKFDRSIVGSSRIGDLQSGFGELILDNTEGQYDYLIRGYALDGRNVKVRFGDFEEAYDGFDTVFDGTAQGWSVEEGQVRVLLRDYGYLLEKPVSPNTYGGTGDLDGTADLKGKRKPRCFGRCQNVSAPLIWPQKLIFQVNDGPVQAIEAVYSRGAAITFATNYATGAALANATIPEGQFATCLAEGLFRINFSLEGQITADVRGDKTGGNYVETTASVIRRLLTIAQVSDANVAAEKFAAVEAIQPAPIGIWFDRDDETLVTGAIDQLISGVGGWAGFRRDGRFEVGILTLPINPPVAAFGEIEIIEIDRTPLPEAIDPPPYRQRAAYARNWTKMDGTNVAPSVTDARRAFLAEDWRLAESDPALAAQVKRDHGMAQDPAPIESFFALLADAQTFVDTQFDLWRVQRSLYRLQLKTQPFLFDIGDVFSATYPRWNLATGKLLRTVSLREDGEANTVELVGFG